MVQKAATQAVPGSPSLRDWFAVEPGLSVAAAELDLAGDALSNLFGYHILQLGNPYPAPLISCSRIQNQVVLATSPACTPASLRCVDDALPVQADSVDVLVLPHVLEFARSPHAVLREAERILIPEGHLAILGFNPWSWYGLWRRAAGWRGRLPWRGRFVGMTRLRDWLTLLGFEVTAGRMACYAPPFAQQKWLRRGGFMEAAGNRWWPFAGGVYFLQAVKRVVGMRVILPRWSENRRAKPALAVVPRRVRRPEGAAACEAPPPPHPHLPSN